MQPPIALPLYLTFRTTIDTIWIAQAVNSEMTR